MHCGTLPSRPDRKTKLEGDSSVAPIRGTRWSPKSAPRYTHNMKCAACGKALPSGMKASARYCGSNCRGDAASSRARTKRKKAHLLAASVGGEISATGQAPSDRPKHVGSTADSESLSTQTDENRILDRKKTQAPPPGRRASPHRLRQPFTLRVDIREQILNQAPSAAMGYGPVLPSVDDAKQPKVVP